MAGNDTRQLQLQISASAELMIRNLRTADAAVGQFQQSTNTKLASIDARFAALGKLKNGLAGIGALSGVQGLIGAATGVSLIEVARRALDYAGSLQEVSVQLGVTTKDLQTYRYAAAQTGVEQDAMDRGLAKLTVTMGKALSGAEKPIKAFKAIGLSLEELKGKTAGDVIPPIADALGKIPDAARRAAVEVELFGKSGQALGSLLAEGGDGLRNLAMEAARLGLVLSDKELAEADRTADKLGQVKAVLEANIARSVVANAEAIYALGDALGSLVQKAARAGSAYDGFLRIVKSEGAQGFVRTFFGDGRDQAEAATPTGYYQQTKRRWQVAVSDARTARQKGRPANVIAGLDAEAMKARGIADRAAYAALTDIRGTKIAVAQARAKLMNPDGVEPAKFLSSGGGGPKGKTAEQLAREAEQDAKRDRADRRRAEDLGARSEMDLLRSNIDRTVDPGERLKLELERIELEKKGRDRDLEEQALDNKYIAANLARLKGINADVAGIDKGLVLQRRAQEVDQDAYDRTRAAQDDGIAMLEIAARLTDIASERRKIEERILAIRQQEEREALERVANDKNGRYSPAERQKVLDELARLPAKQAAEEAALRRDNRTDGERYRDNLPRTAEQLRESIEAIKVNGLEALNDELLDTILNAQSLGDAFHDISKQIIADLLKIAIQRSVIGPLADAFLGKAVGSSGGAAAIFGALKATVTRPPGRASGGPVTRGMPYMVGEVGEELFVPDVSGRIIPNSALRASSIGAVTGASATGGMNGTATIRLELSGDLDARIDGRAAGVAIQVVRTAAPEIRQAAMTDTISALGRTRM